MLLRSPVTSSRSVLPCPVQVRSVTSSFPLWTRNDFVSVGETMRLLVTR